ncbi:MAG: hypothetical protein WCK21_08140 [Actinomycetota bacterium]
MRRPQLQSTFARAVVPVATGIGFFALLFLALWAVASVISHNSKDTTEHLAPSFQEMGRLDSIAVTIKDDGPIILPDLVGDDRHIVLDHTGTADTRGWAIYLAHPADRGSTCNIHQIEHTRQFTDCDGRTLGVSDLALPPQGVAPIVNKDGSLTLSLRATPVTTTG